MPSPTLYRKEAGMANPLSDEQQLFDRIKTEKIAVPQLIWDLMYHYIGDDISAITQIVLTYWRINESIPVEDAKKIQAHTIRINTIAEKILQPSWLKKPVGKLPELQNNNMKMHPVINNLFFHYIGNDVYGINLIVGFHLDPIDTHPIPVEDAQKILNKTETVKQFMDRLREATQQAVTIAEEKSS
jgi:hypothetical protein